MEKRHAAEETLKHSSEGRITSKKKTMYVWTMLEFLHLSVKVYIKKAIWLTYCSAPGPGCSKLG